jgi:hypothetical protein
VTRAVQFPLLISSDPTAAYSELPQQPAKSTKNEKQTQRREKHAKDENEI